MKCFIIYTIKFKFLSSFILTNLLITYFNYSIDNYKLYISKKLLLNNSNRFHLKNHETYIKILKIICQLQVERTS